MHYSDQPSDSDQDPLFAHSVEKIVSTPEIPKSLSHSSKPRRRSWRSLLGLTLLFLVSATGAYAGLEYRSLRDEVIVDGGGDSNGLLTYADTNKTSDLDWSKFKQPGDGRFNVVVMGIGGVNDAGQAHGGTNLTDSIQIVSLDTINKKVGITSIPRDFYYTITGHGGGKINAVYSYGELDNPGKGGQAARTAFGNVLGITISNFVVIDFTAAKEAVDTVGGIDIDVPKALYDATYPCDDDLHTCPFSITAGTHHMDGALALKYMRTRHADNDYGRSARQQQVISAVRKKALSLGFLTNPAKVTSLLNTLGKHIKTDMQPSDIVSFLKIYKDVTPEKTTTNVLDTSTQLGLLTSTTDPVAGFISYPLGGYTAYDPIHQWFQKNNPDPLIARENASITVATTASVSTKQLATFVDKLKDYGFTVTVSSTPATNSTATNNIQIYSSRSSNKPVTTNYLHGVLGQTIQTGSPISSGSDFEIIYSATSKTNQ